MSDMLLDDAQDADAGTMTLVPGNATRPAVDLGARTSSTVAAAMLWWDYVAASNVARAVTEPAPRRPRWRSGAEVRAALNSGARADPGLAAELDAHAVTLADLD